VTFLFVGAGISNISLARLLAENGKTVRIIDRKAHIGGNCFDYFDENSIDIHAYGTSSILMTPKSGDSSLNLPSGIRISMR
jgi:UDP-galactopyranose mutase